MKIGFLFSSTSLWQALWHIQNWHKSSSTRWLWFFSFDCVSPTFVPISMRITKGICNCRFHFEYNFVASLFTVTRFSNHYMQNESNMFEETMQITKIVVIRILRFLWRFFRSFSSSIYFKRRILLVMVVDINQLSNCLILC